MEGKLFSSHPKLIIFTLLSILMFSPLYSADLKGKGTFYSVFTAEFSDTIKMGPSMYKLVSKSRQQRSGCDKSHLQKEKKKNDADGQAKRVNDDKKNGRA